MEYKYRRDIVGKRFLSVKSEGKLKLSRISEWEWKSGIIRACTEQDFKHPDISILVEFDGVLWQKREWIKPREVFQIFLIEKTLVWAPKPCSRIAGCGVKSELECGNSPAESVAWPALNYMPVVDRVGFSRSNIPKPVEFFPNKKLEYVPECSLRVYKESDQSLPGPSRDDAETSRAVRAWLEYQNSQQILQETPSVLIGYRAQVYRADGTTQWYTAVINSYDEANKELHVTDDTVLEEHWEDPTLVQICLLGDGVVDAILKGDNAGVRPSRTRRSHENRPMIKPTQKSAHAGETEAKSTTAVLQKVTPESPKHSPKPSPKPSPKQSPKVSPKAEALPSSVKSTTLTIKGTKSSETLLKSVTKSRPTSPKSSLGDHSSTAIKPSSRTIIPALSCDLGIQSQPPQVASRVNSGKYQTSNLSDITLTSTERSSVTSRPVRQKITRSSCPPSLSSPAKSEKSAPTESKSQVSAEETIKLASTPSKSLVSQDTPITPPKRKSPHTLLARPVVELFNIGPQLCQGRVSSSCSTITTASPKLARSRSFCESKTEIRNNIVRSPRRSHASSESSPIVKRRKSDRLLEVAKSENAINLPNKSVQSESTSSEDILDSFKDQNCLADARYKFDDKDEDLSSVKVSQEKDETVQIKQVAVSQKQTKINEDDVRRANELYCFPDTPPCIAPVTQVSSHVVYRGQHFDAATEIQKLPKPASNSGESHNSRNKCSLLASKKSSNKEDNNTMALHYKKLMLVDSKKDKSVVTTSGSSVSECGGIDVNHSILDQIVRLKKGDESKRKLEEQDAAVSLAALASSNGSLSQSTQRPSPVETVSSTDRDFPRSKDRNRSNPCVNEQNNNMYSRNIDNQSSNKDREDYNRPSSSRSERGPSTTPPNHNNIKPSSASPLLPDRNRRFEPYRDPELLKKDSEVLRMREIQLQQASLRPSHTPIPTSSSYPGVHTPIPSPLPTGHPAALASAASVPPTQSHALINPYAALAPLQHLQMSNNSTHVHALLQQQQVAAHLQQLQLLQHQQQQSQILSSFTLQQNSLQARQLEQLWQQKFPNMSVPPAWMLHQYQDDLLRDVHRDLMDRERQREIIEKERAEREQRERSERDRLEREQRDRAERERIERERAERAERERQERHERERREKMERERLDRERAEREKIAQEHKEKQEQQLRLDRERILMESSAVADAVNQHFQESLIRLASQKPGASQPPASHMLMTPGQQYPHHLMLQHQHAVLLQQQAEEKSKMATVSTSSQDNKLRMSPHESKPMGMLPGVDPRVYHGMFPQSNRIATSATTTKAQELNFSLYGYKPNHHVYISQDELTAIGLEKAKADSKEQGDERRHSPPPLIRDNKSVIVDNRPKDLSNSAPHQLGSITLGTAMHKPHSDMKTSSSTSSTIPSSTMAAASILASMPLQGARPGAALQQNSAGLNLTMAYSSQVKTEPAEISKSGPKPGTAPPGVGSRQMSHVAQPPISVSAGMSYNYGLVQHGLVPNPLYSQASVKHEPAPQPMVSPASHKRRSPKETNQVGPRKKVKIEAVEGTAPQSTSPCLSQPSTLPMDVTPTQLALVKSAATATYMDSFRSFVMNAVHHAFMNDDDLNGKKNYQPATSGSSQSGSEQTYSTASLNSSTTTVSSVSAPSISTSPVNTMPGTTYTANTTGACSPKLPQVPCTQRPGPASTPGGASISSTSSIADTINRVANGMETDSDTLSAPSPPSQSKWDPTGPSPLKTSGASHTKSFKKAWLARYSDQGCDKPFPPSNDNSMAESVKSENSMDSFTPASNASAAAAVIPAKPTPVKEEVADPSQMLPFIRVRELNMRDDGAVSSASETESHDSGSRKRAKGGKKKQPATDKKEKTKDKVKEEKDRPKEEDLTTTNAKKPKVTSTPERADSPVTSVSANSGAKRKKGKGKGSKGEEEAVPSPATTPKPVETPPPPPPRQPTPEPPKPQPMKKIGKTKLEKPEPKVFSDSEVKMERKLREKGKELEKKKEANLSSFLANKPLNKEPVAKLKKSMEPFLQDGPCTEITPKLTKCRECKMPPNQRNKKIANANIFCRFYAFRRLRYSSKAHLMNAGFSEPSDADADDIELWYPCTPVSEPHMNIDIAKYVIANVGDRFCDLVEQERIAMSWVSPDTKIAWKRAVQGVREMCDVCDTTLFNMHWVCHKCGFVVCIDCYKLRSRKSHGCTDKNCKSCEKDGHKWLTCSVSRQAHEPEKLMLTQIIPSDVLWVLGRMIHEVREQCNIPANCPCGRSRFDQLLAPKNGISQSIFPKEEQKSVKDKSVVNGVAENHAAGVKSEGKVENGPNFDPLNMLAVAAVYKQDSEKHMISDNSKTPVNGQAEDKDSSSQCSTLRDLLTRAGGTTAKNETKTGKKPEITHSTLEDIIQKVVEKSHPNKGEGEIVSPKRIVFKHYRPRNGTHMQGRDIPIPTYTLTETSVVYPDIPHAWLDHGRLLWLLDPKCKSNVQMFQKQWQRAQPVLVSNCNKYFDKDLWNPTSFCREFGDLKNDLVNCENHSIIIGHKMKSFWDGFEKISARLKDSKLRPMIMKLKDWPPTEDFAEMLPNRYADLMQCLPLPEYTNRQGVFNLASRLPEFFVKPDLGPKMYNAYGSSLTPNSGTTNLHLDVSDAVNMMLYVGIPVDDKDNAEQAAAMKVMQLAGACTLTQKRIKEGGEKPGALWHIYDPQDADKIRDMLNKMGKERGDMIEPHHDPIHDQSWYLDAELREILLRDYGVQGYTIVQCLGDAVFIPAGAPHQVQNLHSCIKAAEDFVSPENMTYCFRMTQEFRHLSDTHSNHEDKLQIKNIIYHAVKDAVATLRTQQPESP